MKSHDDLVEEVRDLLIQYDEEIIMDALVQSNIINERTGCLTEWWLNMLNPDILKNRLKLAKTILEEILKNHEL